MHNFLRQLAAILLVVLLTVPAAFAVPAETRTVNVNQDSAEVIADVLDGVGLRRAEAIVEYRETYGDFVELDDLIDVRGIGETTLAANAERIRFE